MELISLSETSVSTYQAMKSTQKTTIWIYLICTYSAMHLKLYSLQRQQSWPSSSPDFCVTCHISTMKLIGATFRYGSVNSMRPMRLNYNSSLSDCCNIYITKDYCDIIYFFRHCGTLQRFVSRHIVMPSSTYKWLETFSLTTSERAEVYTPISTRRSRTFVPWSRAEQ
jgi:hypothetical protein